jgi:Raf kinase inhibitor-like YbhB/YbcL family protein
VVFDIPASAMGLASGASGKLPRGAIEARGDAGVKGFVGACPPPGAPHHYVLTVRALKIEKLGLGADASVATVGFMTNANKLGEVRITAIYGR